MTVQQLANYLRVSRTWVLRHKLPHKRVGKRKDRFFVLEEVMEYLRRFV